MGEEGGSSRIGASGENGGDLPNEPVHSRQLAWIVRLKFETYFPYSSYKISSTYMNENHSLGPHTSCLIVTNIRSGASVKILTEGNLGFFSHNEHKRNS